MDEIHQSVRFGGIVGLAIIALGFALDRFRPRQPDEVRMPLSFLAGGGFVVGVGAVFYRSGVLSGAASGPPNLSWIALVAIFVSVGLYCTVHFTGWSLRATDEGLVLKRPFRRVSAVNWVEISSITATRYSVSFNQGRRTFAELPPNSRGLAKVMSRAASKAVAVPQIINRRGVKVR